MAWLIMSGTSSVGACIFGNLGFLTSRRFLLGMGLGLCCVPSSISVCRLANILAIYLHSSIQCYVLVCFSSF